MAPAKEKSAVRRAILMPRIGHVMRNGGLGLAVALAWDDTDRSLRERRLPETERSIPPAITGRRWSLRRAIGATGRSRAAGPPTLG